MVIDIKYGRKTNPNTSNKGARVCDKTHIKVWESEKP